MIKLEPQTPLSPPPPKDSFKKLGREFEAMFWREMLKNMSSGSINGGEGEEEGGAGSSGYREMFHESLADTLASRGALGLEEFFRRNVIEPGASPACPPTDSTPRGG